ncbi:deoxynucleoside kinase [Anaerolineales bacterium HSG24]|nr:deoxynucleoside kinase [Anaerolineales bacterium HSG24]
MQRKSSIVIAGNVGVGKSSFTHLLSESLRATPFYEAVDDNPYLADFYQDMRQWSFHSQIFFLTRRLETHRQLVDHPGSVIQDRSIYEDAEIFARNLHERGNMIQRDYQLYRNLYDASLPFLPKPTLIVYLKASVPTLISRIQHRGRDFERNISPLYLQQLNELYNAWIEDFTLCPVLVIPTDRLDFVQHESDFEAMKTQITNMLDQKNLKPLSKQFSSFFR